jgi:hypothetical protein
MWPEAEPVASLIRHEVPSMKRTYTLQEANAAIPLLRTLAVEFAERRNSRRLLARERHQMEQAKTPEGLSQELAELDARIYEHDEVLFACRREFEALGMKILRPMPLTIHIPGESRSGAVVFCYEEGEDRICYGHPLGEEEDQRRPLRQKAV